MGKVISHKVCFPYDMLKDNARKPTTSGKDIKDQEFNFPRDIRFSIKSILCNNFMFNIVQFFR